MEEASIVKALPASHPSAGDAWRETLGRRRTGAVAWIARARCRGLGPALFYPDADEDAVEARKLCAECGVRKACLQYALDANENSVCGAGRRNASGAPCGDAGIECAPHEPGNGASRNRDCRAVKAGSMLALQAVANESQCPDVLLGVEFHELDEQRPQRLAMQRP